MRPRLSSWSANRDNLIARGASVMISRQTLSVFLTASFILLTACSRPANVTPSPTGPPPLAATSSSGDAAGYLAAGETALSRNDFATAEKQYRDAATLDPRSAKAQFGLGNVYVRQGRFAEAEQAYKAALALEPGMTAAQTNLGVTYYQMGQLSKATDSLTTALKAEPNDAKTLYLVAVIRLQENNLPEAEELLVKARGVDPNLPEVYYGLGVLYRLKGQKEDAIKAFEKFLAIGPGQDPGAVDHARQELEALKGK
jgi:protein O-GlcNAc transferase